MFLAVSDIVWQAVIGGFVTLLLAWMNLRLGKIAKTGAQTHALVNSASLIQMRLYAVSARRIAELTNDETDLAAALAAEKLVAEHEKKQKEADTVGSGLTA